MTVYSVTRPGSGKQFCIYRTWADVEAEFDGAELGHTIHVELREMTQEELDKLPDFGGW